MKHKKKGSSNETTSNPKNMKHSKGGGVLHNILSQESLTRSLEGQQSELMIPMK